MPRSGVPVCPICCDLLGTAGGPATLPCGHNGCRHCLLAVQRQQQHPACPLCRAPIPPGYELVSNTELRDLISMATSVLLTDERERQEGWEAFPDSSSAAEQYATDLKLGREAAQQLQHAPSAPPAPELPGTASAAACRELMLLPPPQWLPDSMASACGACGRPFRPLVRLRHHCRCCGRIFCSACTAQCTLLPPRFNTREPLRACDTCVAMLAPLQPYLAATQSPSAQPPVHDAVLDAVSLRSWFNAPYCAALDQDVYKAANVLAKFTQAGRLQPEAHLPSSVLAGMKGLAVMSVLRLGAGWSATAGTGLVVSRSPEGAWSAPCAVAAYGVGWGLQLGGEITDLVLVLRTDEAVRAFCGAVHVGVGGSCGAAVGPLGRSANATVLVGSVGRAPEAAYAYSCSQGAFIGISVEGCMLQVRDQVNRAFYGLPVTAHSLLVERSVAAPVAAAALYDSLHALSRKFEHRRPPLTRSASTSRLPAALQQHASHAWNSLTTALTSLSSTAESAGRSSPAGQPASALAQAAKQLGNPDFDDGAAAPHAHSNWAGPQESAYNEFGEPRRALGSSAMLGENSSQAAASADRGGHSATAAGNSGGVSRLAAAGVHLLGSAVASGLQQLAAHRSGGRVPPDSRMSAPTKASKEGGSAVKATPAQLTSNTAGRATAAPTTPLAGAVGHAASYYPPLPTASPAGLVWRAPQRPTSGSQPAAQAAGPPRPSTTQPAAQPAAVSPARAGNSHTHAHTSNGSSLRSSAVHDALRPFSGPATSLSTGVGVRAAGDGPPSLGPRLQGARQQADAAASLGSRTDSHSGRQRQAAGEEAGGGVWGPQGPPPAAPQLPVARAAHAAQAPRLGLPWGVGAMLGGGAGRRGEEEEDDDESSYMQALFA